MGNPLKMKASGTLLAICGLLLFPLASAAQEFHFYGGYNGSNVAKAGEENWTGRSGYQFGADVVIGNRWFLKPGIAVLVRNLDYTYAGTAPDGSMVYPDDNFDYTSRSLLIPVMLGLNLFDPASDPALNVYIMGGPSAMMNLNADLNNDALHVETNSTQWYLGFGGGLEFSFLFLEAGYDVAMSNVFEGSGFDTNPKVNFLHLNAGVRLKLAR